MKNLYIYTSLAFKNKGNLLFWDCHMQRAVCYIAYKIPLYPLALREISEQLTWDILLRKYRGGPVKWDTL